MPRLRRSLRRTLFALLGAVVLTSALLVGALAASAPRLLSGGEHARTGAGLLFSNPREAAEEFQQAHRQFRASWAGIGALPEPARFPSLIPPFSWYIRLNKAAVYLGQAGEDAAALASSYPASTDSDDPAALLGAHSAALATLRSEQAARFTSLTRNLELASTELDRVPRWILPGKHRELAALKDQVRLATTSLPRALGLLAGVEATFTGTEPQTALIIFQNHGELRPSGGFMGSYAVVTGSGGRIRDFQFGDDIYRIDRALEANQLIPAPPYLQTITPWWGFRDSNIGQGFLQEIGPQVADFYELATGVRPVSILFTDLSILEDALRATGPVTLPGTDTELDSELVSTALTTYVEREYWNTAENRAANSPKSVIGELIPVLLHSLRGQPAAMRQVPGIIAQASARKSLQLWTETPALAEAAAPLFPVDAPAGADWLKVVNSNIGGKKSSRNVRQVVTMTEKRRHGWRERAVTITRTHEGSGVWPDDENRNYTELYLPPEAEVLERPEGKGGEQLLPEWKQAELGILGTRWPGETKREERWVRVGFWSTTSVAEQTEFTVQYRVPDTAEFRGPFTYLKQAGAEHETLRAFGYDGSVTRNLVLEKKRWFW